MGTISDQPGMTVDQLRRVGNEIQRYRASWKVGFASKTLIRLEEERDTFEALLEVLGRASIEDLGILEELDGRIELIRDRLIRQGKTENPLAYERPTWEQAQFLNAWSPEFEPDDAPEGYNTVANFGGKRSGKTVGTILNVILWTVPNDPSWSIFGEHTDPHGRGKYRVLRRPMYDIWQRKGRMVYSDDEPPVQGRNIWHGCVDEAHWKTKIDRAYRKWMPMQFIKRHADGQSLMWNLTDRYFETAWGVRVTGMLYKSDIQAWGGEELFMTVFDEGPPRPVVEEVIARSLYIGWSYTPAEAANTADRVQVAREVYEGKLQLVGRTKIAQSDMRKVPEEIMSRKLLDMRISSLTRLGEAGRIAMEGGFYDTSPRVFDLFDANRHVLPVTDAEVSRAIRGESTREELTRFPWLEKFNCANIIRGFDEGFVHATACIWVAILRTGERVAFREFSETSTSIAERCRAIVELSGNALEPVETEFDASEERQWVAAQFGHEIDKDRQREKATGENIRRFYERERDEVIRKTFGDSKLFKRDPKYLMDTWGEEYRRKGLRLERASSLLPEQRCNYTNGLFRANPSRRHLNPAQESEEYPNGYDLYLTVSCRKLRERLERYLWEQIASGTRQGQFTGKPSRVGDDEIDALTYATCSKLRWVPQDEIKARHDLRHAA